jgi:hypothetical protein
MWRAMLQLRQLVASFSQQMPRFILRAVFTGFVVEKWHWERFFSETFSFPISIIPPLLHIYSCIMWELDIGPVHDGSSGYINSAITSYRRNASTLHSNVENVIWYVWHL